MSRDNHQKRRPAMAKHTRVMTSPAMMRNSITLSFEAPRRLGSYFLKFSE